MRVAGIRRTGGNVETLEVPDPPPLAEDEVLIQVKAAGVANWDELVAVGRSARTVRRRLNASSMPRPYGRRAHLRVG